MSSSSFVKKIVKEMKEQRIEINKLKEDLLSTRFEIESLKDTISQTQKIKRKIFSEKPLLQIRKRNVDVELNKIFVNSVEIEKDRFAIIKFNKENNLRQGSDKLSWKSTSKNGVQLVFTTVNGNTSLLDLIQSEHKGLLNSYGEEVERNFTTNVIKKYGVLIKDGKLIPLSSDFKDGIGARYLWTSDEDMAAFGPSTTWKNDTKKSNDPRIVKYDPETNELWKGHIESVIQEEDVDEEDDCSGSEEEDDCSGSEDDSDDEDSHRYSCIGSGSRGKEMLFNRCVVDDSDDQSDCKRRRMD